MGAMKDYLHDLREARMRGADHPADQERYAEALNGEIDGDFILCSSPGYPPDDRSCRVRVTGPRDVFIYSCEGSQGGAYADVRKRLGFPSVPQRNNSDFVRQIRDESVIAAGTPVETYLRSRGITMPVPPTLLFHPSLKHRPMGGSWSAMVGVVTDVNDRFVAVHRTYLQLDGRGKAPVDPVKMTLGPITGGAIRLGPVASTIAVGEGIETCLSVVQTAGIPAWAAMSAGGMRSLNLPPEVREVIVLADADAIGERAAQAAARRWVGEGRAVRIARPTRGKDFNDMLMEETGQ